MLVLCAALVCGLSGCAAPSLSSRAALSQSHLDEQGGYLNSAISHLQAAHDRMQSQPDPHQAGEELDAGRSAVGLAQADAQKISQDVHDLAQSEASARQTAVSLQHEIDSHRNDLLGPRAKRIRNHLILCSVLIGIGWGLLKIGPLFGGPFGGGVLVLGHLLTGFLSPLVSTIRFLLAMLWRGIVSLTRWGVARLEKLGNAKSAGIANPPAMAPAAGKGG